MTRVVAAFTNIADNPQRMLAYYVHDLNPLIFRIYDNVGPRWYGLAYVLAFLCAYLLFQLLVKRGYADLPLSKVGDFITGVALFGVIVGGRVGWIIFYGLQQDHSRDPWWWPLAVWQGGMSSHGGMLGIFFFALFYARRHQLSWRNLGDNLVVAAPLGLFFGRCANFINGELYGRATNLAWAMQFPKELTENFGEANQAITACVRIDPSLNSSDAIVAAVRDQPQVKEILRGILTPRHPSQLYEAFFEGIVLFAILWFVRTRMRQPNGFLIGLFFICYAIFRIVVENFRQPDAILIAMFAHSQFFRFTDNLDEPNAIYVFSLGQFLSFFLIAIGVAFIVNAKLRPSFPKAFARS
jgi:phosphatidylglycerol:prolipoprotein diacylglycerol transferase